MNSEKRSIQQNVDNMEVFTEKVITFQPVYDPSELRLSIPNQKKIKANGDEVLLSVIAAESDCDNATSARTNAFDPLHHLVTRVINALRISDVPEQTILQGESIVRELRNKRASAIAPISQTSEATENEASPKTNKMRSGSFDTIIENFTKLVALLSSLPAYKPKESELTIESLKEKLEALKAVNLASVTADAKAEAARLQRDTILYADKIGLFDVAMDSKIYVKSAYGATSPQYKSISGILFTRPR